MRPIPTLGELLVAALRSAFRLRGGRHIGLALGIAWRSLRRDRAAEREALVRLAELYGEPPPRRAAEAARLWRRMVEEMGDSGLSVPERRARVLAVLAAGVALELAVDNPSFPRDASDPS